MRRPSQICDYFIIASGDSSRQVRAISENIEEKVREKGLKVSHKEGYKDCTWVLLDYNDIVVHIFMQDARNFYDLERLWSDAPKVETHA